MPAFSSRVAKKAGNILGRGRERTWDPSTADWWVSNRSVSQACCPGKSTPSPHLVTAHTLASACFRYSSTESCWNSSSEQFCNEAVAVALSEDIMKTHTHTHTQTHLFNGPFSGTTQVGRYQKAKTNFYLLKQETVSGSGISWAICKSAPRSWHITTPAPTTQIFTGRMPFLPPNQQRQSTEDD